MTGTEGFFEERTEQSRVKAAIVEKYFDAWSRVMMANQKRYRGESDWRIAYIDLFAGPGRYEDGTESTPLLVLKKALEHDELRERLVVILNDKNPGNCEQLAQAISEIPDIESLAHQPQILNVEVGEEIVEVFRDMKLVPTLFFVDPWGYKGVSLDLIDSLVKDWGCDGIFFFNYNRINMGLDNDLVEEHMNALFGEKRATELREMLRGLDPDERETAVVENLTEALKARGPEYVLPFCFRNESGTRTKHHLIFVTKSFRGYDIMKDIMARESSTDTQGVPSFDYCRADRTQPLLFDLSRPLEDLEEMLLEKFSGRSLKFKRLYEMHSIDLPYVKKNYREVLIKMEQEGKIRCDPPAEERRSGTFAGRTVITFP